MMTNEEMHLYDYLVETDIATPNELNLARHLVSGSWQTVLETVLFVRTGYRTLQQLIEAEDEDYNDDVDECGYNPYLGGYDFDC